MCLCPSPFSSLYFFPLSPPSPSKILLLFNLTCEICAPSYAFNPSPQHRLSVLLLLTLSPVKHCYSLFQYSSTSSLQNFYNLGLFCSWAWTSTSGKISNVFHYAFTTVKSTLQSDYQNKSIRSEWQLAHCVGQFIYQGAPDWFFFLFSPLNWPGGGGLGGWEQRQTWIPVRRTWSVQRTPWWIEICCKDPSVTNFTKVCHRQLE